jgi:lipopolysaccharide transport system ATP-binding protein
MNDIAIRVENLGKLYRIGSRQNGYKTLRESITNAVSSPFRRISSIFGHRSAVSSLESSVCGPRSAVGISPLPVSGQPSAVASPDPAVCGLRSAVDSSTFWALKNISFEVKRGEVVGIIGRNGAGKSTLLKILSRITEPSEGYAEIRGRVGSLLEVGTGFHAELSGRENIYLSGAILGMRKTEIERKFDEIVAFAEIDEFIDTPVKHYSSGMYVRLAFAVAAHLEPEVLLVDEVLAVGDAQFQKKCLGKIRDVAEEGRTVLFVSHNMDAIRRLSNQAIWLDNGGVKKIGMTVQCVSEYLSQGVTSGGEITFNPPHQLGNGLPILLHRILIENEMGTIATRFSVRSLIRVRIEWENFEPVYKPRIGFVLQTSDGLEVLTALDANSWENGEWVNPRRRISSCIIPGQLLNEGVYVIEVGGDSPTIDHRYPFCRSRTQAILRFEMEDDMTLPNKYYGQEGFRDIKWPGVLLLNLSWDQEDVCLDSFKESIGANHARKP